MDLTNFAIAIVILIFTILSISTSSIALECYNKSPALKQTKQANYYFIIINLVCSIILALLSMRSMYTIYSS